MLLNGCANAPNDSAICNGTAQSRTSHAAALVADGGPHSMVTGALLIQQIDAGCRITVHRERGEVMRHTASIG
jgi:hypothetical protein